MVMVSSEAVVTSDDRCSVVAFVAKDRRRAHLEDARRFLRDGHEDALRARLGGDEGGDAAQRALFLGELADLGKLRLWIPLEGAVLEVARAVGQIDAGGHQVERLAVMAWHQSVRPGDQPAATFLRHPVADLRAREPRRPDICEHCAECIGLLGRDDEIAGVAAEHLVARKPRRTYARIVEEENAPCSVQDADERHRRLGQDLGELVADDEFRGVRHRRRRA